MRKHLKKDFKFWLTVFTFAALGFLIYISWHQIVDAFGKLASLNLIALLLMIPVQLLSYYAVARLYKDYFDSQDTRIRLKEVYKMVLELNFINHVFPSGGVSGFSYLSYRMKDLGVSTSKSTLAQILRFALTFITFIAILVFGLITLSLGHDTNPFVVLVASSIIGATIFGTAIAMFIISKASRIKAFVSWLPKAVNLVAKYFKNGRSLIDIARVERVLEELHVDYKVLTADKKLIKKLLKWALITNAAEVATIYVVYIAFGSLINPGALIIAYAIANFAGLVAVLPGGVGIYEGLMTAALASAGVEGGLALSATVVYRILNMALFIPPGYYYYQKAIKKLGTKPNLEDAAVFDSK